MRRRKTIHYCCRPLHSGRKRVCWICIILYCLLRNNAKRISNTVEGKIYMLISGVEILNMVFWSAKCVMLIGGVLSRVCWYPSLPSSDIKVWDVLTELVEICTAPCPPNPFAVDLDYFKSLQLPERALASAAMIAFLQKLIASGPHHYDRRG